MIALFATITDKDRNKRKGFLEPHPQELPNGTVYSLRISQRSAAIFDFLLFRLSEMLTLSRKRAPRGSSFTFSIMTWQIWLAVDLRVYADALDGEIYHYRDKTIWNATPYFTDGMAHSASLKLNWAAMPPSNTVHQRFECWPQRLTSKNGQTLFPDGSHRRR